MLVNVVTLSEAILTEFEVSSKDPSSLLTYIVSGNERIDIFVCFDFIIYTGKVSSRYFKRSFFPSQITLVDVTKQSHNGLHGSIVQSYWFLYEHN